MPKLLQWFLAASLLLPGCRQVYMPSPERTHPPVPDGSLLENGDFEFSKPSINSSWWGVTHPSLQLAEKEGRGGSRCLVLQTQGEEWLSSAHVTQVVQGTFAKGHVVVKAWVRTLGKVKGLLSCEARESHEYGLNNYYDSLLSKVVSQPISSEEWHQIEITCPILKGTTNLSVELSLDAEGHGGPLGWIPAKDAQGKVFFDDVEAIFTADKP